MKKYMLNTFLAAVFTAVLLVMVFARAMCPVLIFPGFGVPNLVLISLIALLLDHYIVKDAPRCYICIPVFAFLTFAILPLTAGIIAPSHALILGIKGKLPDQFHVMFPAYSLYLHLRPHSKSPTGYCYHI